ncbi:sulfate adenylyltransferase subunit CysN [Pelagibaculum spongiae]|uniref:Sulfate adenylyltransferase subunit 1 n=1 Tax=Pelagibaculum spongiae TaxID=2080658 RepID=A0A2V1H235_9GAMM|nr:sulfate adenylyltransferase subunit CysN [Pelagibaculum spongiae]PVZ68966.1 sulfate adenylyltransferase subunit CysN [Pelagibaculum spongiae]
MSHQSELIAEDINEYLHQHEQKELLRLLTCGSVDDGKSTLIGRLLHDSKMIYEDQLAAVTKDSDRMGNAGEKLDLALLVDGLQAEREQGITIDVAYRYFSTDKRKFIIADTPGHEQYTRNMATGASNCDLAIILIDARYGVMTQTRRHSFIASLLGIKHIVVAINKMDLKDFDQSVYESIKADYLEFSDNLTFGDIQFVPISALDGDNVVSVSERSPWYQGKPLMEILETVKIANDKNFDDFRLPVQYVNRPNLDFRGYCGTIASGVIKPGDQVSVLPSGKSSHVKSIVTADGDLQRAFAGQAVTVTLEDEIDISRGDMLVRADNPCQVSQKLKAHVVWMAEDVMQPGKQYLIKQATTVTPGSFTAINHKIDVNSLEQQSAEQLQLNEIAVCEFTVNRPLAFDAYQNNRGTGSFIVIDRLTNVTIGAGMILSAVDDGAQLSPVTLSERQARLGHSPAVIALEGERAEEVSKLVERRLFDAGIYSAILDNRQLGLGSELQERLIESYTNAGLVLLLIGQAAVKDHYQLETDGDFSEKLNNLIDQLSGSSE